jgi:hypothetical protein
VNRHIRQVRLIEVGAAGQARLASYQAEVPGVGLRARVAARYLAGAGITRLRVADAATAAEALAVDPSVQTEVDPALACSQASARLALGDPVASQVAEGAMDALRAFRAALGESHVP